MSDRDIHELIADAANHAATLASPEFDLALYLGARYSLTAQRFGPKRLVVGTTDLMLRPDGRWFGRPMVAEPLSVGSAYYGRSGE